MKELIEEAFRIAEGRTMMAGTTRHVVALVKLIKAANIDVDGMLGPPEEAYEAHDEREAHGRIR